MILDVTDKLLDAEKKYSEYLRREIDGLRSELFQASLKIEQAEKQVEQLKKEKQKLVESESRMFYSYECQSGWYQLVEDGELIDGFFIRKSRGEFVVVDKETLEERLVYNFIPSTYGD